MNSKNENILKNLESLLLFENEKDILEIESELLHLKFVKVIERLMKSEGINKSELANQLSTSKSYITQLFSGNKLLNIKMLVKIQHVLNFNFSISSENRKSNFTPLSCEKFKKPFNLDSFLGDKSLGNKYQLDKQAKKLKLIA